MLIYYFDDSSKKVEEIHIKKLVVGVDHATATLNDDTFKLIEIRKLLYIVEE